MKKLFKKLATLTLAGALLMGLLVMQAAAEEAGTGENEKWNIMLVVDGSASLFSDKKTDPDELRFEAIGSFLATLNADSADVGAIIFTSNDTRDASDEAMRRGIQLNTGVLPLSDPATRQFLLDSMMGVKHDNRSRGQTDIGTAILCAQETLSALDSDRKSAIFLFTDGITDVDGTEVRNKSMENMETAINNIRDEGILLCGVYLNKDGAQESSEVRNIVMRANNVADNSLSLGDLYVEITDAKSCVDSTDHFLRALGYSLLASEGEDDEIIYESVNKTIRIPGLGVEEANIRLRTLDGQPLPQDMDVSFTQPDGTVLSGAAAAAICSTGGSYRVYKLSKPMSGTWTIHIVLPEGNSLGIKYNPIFNMNVGAVMSSSPEADQLHANMDVSVEAQLTQSGQIITEPDAYREYSCTLHMTNTSTGERESIDISQDGNSRFTKILSLNRYAIYDVYMEFNCDKVSVRTAPASWVLSNRAPSVRERVCVDAPYGLLQRAKELELSEFARDTEDLSNISYRISGGNCNLDGVSISGDRLTLRGELCGSGTVLVDVIDSQGASSQMQLIVTAENVTVKVALVIVGLLLLAGIVVLLIIRYFNGITPPGYCTASLTVEGTDGEGEGQVSLEPAAPGAAQGLGHRVTLYDILCKELEKSGETQNEQNSRARAKAFVEENIKALKNIKVRCIRERVRENVGKKRKKVIALAITYSEGKSKTKKTLYNDSVRLLDTNVEFGYYYADSDWDEDDYI